MRAETTSDPITLHVRRRARAEFRCVGCGYGAAARMAPERCPMCGGSVWDQREWRPWRELAPAGSARGRESPGA